VAHTQAHMRARTHAVWSWQALLYSRHRTVAPFAPTLVFACAHPCAGRQAEGQADRRAHHPSHRYGHRLRHRCASCLWSLSGCLHTPLFILPELALSARSASPPSELDTVPAPVCSCVLGSRKCPPGQGACTIWCYTSLRAWTARCV